MNTIKIEVPEGFEIDSFDKTTGEVLALAKQKLKYRKTIKKQKQ